MISYPPIPWEDPDWRNRAWDELQAHVYGQIPRLGKLPSEPQDSGRFGDAGGWETFVIQTPFGRSITILHAFPDHARKGTLVGASFHGNAPLLADPTLETYPILRILQAGYALATFDYIDAVPDDPVAAAPILADVGGGIGAVGLWGWGLAAVAQEVAGPICFVGHSRLGKAALVAGALAAGTASVIAIQSGTGGAAPSRKGVGETVDQITSMFPHWFTTGFRVDTLPFDQHWLLALIAPAGLLLLNAREDEWADPVGQEQMASLARPAWQDPARVQTFLRPGGHAVTQEDWKAILRFLNEDGG